MKKSTLTLLLFLVLLACSPKSALPSVTATEPNTQPVGPTVPGSKDSLPLASPTISSAPQAQISGVATDVLNIRAGPGINYAVKGQLKQGDTITITGKSADGLWWQCSEGWVSATYIQLRGDPSLVPVSTPLPMSLARSTAMSA